LRGVFELTNNLQAYNDIVTGLQSGISIPRVPLPTVPTPAVPGAATGGLFGDGLLRVGERGEEMVASGATRLGVFPNSFVTAVEALTDVMTQSYSPAGASASSTTYDYSMNPTYNGGAGTSSAERQRIAIMRIMRR
jgi:hypothetical protein